MKTIHVPYYKSSMPLHIDEKNLKAVISTDEGSETDRDEIGIIKEALEHPVGSPKLRELARGKKKVVLVTSDHTRAVPSKLTLPILLEEIRKGNPDADITILIATGLHRATTEAEMRDKFGDEITDNEKIVVNNAYAEGEHTFVKVLPSGAEFWVNRLAAECDLLVTEGFIEPHFFAGFSGGRKSILPGICNAATVNENHSYKAVSSPFAKAGVMENNPINEDMIEAAKAVNVQFIFNVALNAGKKIIAAFAGDLIKAHEKGVEFVRRGALRPAVPAEIVVTGNSGYPLDQNLYQCAKAISTAEASVLDGGVIVIACSCCDGFGGSYFARLITMGTTEEIEAYLSNIPPRETIPEMWNVQVFQRALRKAKIIVVTDFMDHKEIEKANMMAASTLDEALEMAYRIMGKDAGVTVIPDGISVLIV